LARFFSVLALVTLVILGLGIFGAWSLPSFYYQSLLLLFISTGGLYYYLLKIREKRPDYFVLFYLASIIIKLLAYGAYLALIIWEDRPGAFGNVVFFIAVYFLFTALEVGFLWQQMNSK
jgi:hypothetical protein